MAQNTIKILTALQQYYLRPGTYIGSTENPDTLLKEMIDNSSDELLNKFANRIEITTKPKEGWYQVKDDGRGLPLSVFHTDNPDMKHLNGEIEAKNIYCREFSSGKYDKNLYPYSSGTNGIGAKVINVFSTRTHIRVKDKNNLHDGKVYELILGWDQNRNQTCEEHWLDPSSIQDFWWSTEITCWPDPEVFDNLTAKVKDIPLQVIKLSRPKVQISINGKEVEPFSFKDNIETNILSEKIFNKTFKYGTFIVNLTFAWSNKEFSTYYKGTVNLGTSNEGVHIAACRKAIGLALQRFNPALTATDADFGLRLFSDALVYYPKYTGQVKEKLSGLDDFKSANAPVLEKYKHLITFDKGREVTWRVKEAASQDKDWQDITGFEKKLSDEIYKLLKDDEKYTEYLVNRIIEYKKLNDQISDEGYINSRIKTGSDKNSRVSVKGVIEAISSNRKECELYLCEGKSAGGPIKSSRDRLTQALFELRGKPMNVASSEDIKEIVDNTEIRTVINAIGIGMLSNVKIEDARYGKIIIATDADADGEHIQGLVLGALCYLCPQVFTGNAGETMVYIADAPLYKQNGKFIYEEKDVDFKKDFKRFKGLGSMIESDLAQTVVTKKTRKLKKITLESEELQKALTLITSSAAKKELMVENGLLRETM